jgi:putative Holliday junction resolvase
MDIGHSNQRRWIGIDYGLKRIGLAVGDPRHKIASPFKVIGGAKGAESAARQVLDALVDVAIEGVVVGLPLNMDGSAGEQARITRAFADRLAKLIDRPIREWDERLSTVSAEESMADRNLTRKQRAARRDATAAAIILQGFLDSLE